MLNSRPFKRFFAFGCSFTNYHWAMWPEIVHKELGEDVEFHNLGYCGAGNQYIAHQMYVANETYHFGSDDLVMVCWSSAFRNDWYINSNWTLEGNAMFPGEYNAQLDIKLQDLNHYTIRDASIIARAVKFLENSDCVSHHLAMINNFVNDDQDHGYIEQQILDHPECKPYVDYLKDRISMSFWDAGYDVDYNKKLWYPMPVEIRDDHPLPNTSMEYLSRVLDYEFSETTKKTVNDHHDKLWEIILEFNDDYTNHHSSHHLYQRMLDRYPDFNQLS